MTGKLAAAFQTLQPATPAPADPLAGLSPREQEILAHIARGASNKEIARALDIAETTVKIHVQHLLRKLGLDSRVQAAVLRPDAAGRDLLVSAQTGSGKTVAYGLALAPTLLGEAERFGVYGSGRVFLRPGHLLLAPRVQPQRFHRLLAIEGHEVDGVDVEGREEAAVRRRPRPYPHPPLTL